MSAVPSPADSVGNAPTRRLAGKCANGCKSDVLVPVAGAGQHGRFCSTKCRKAANARNAIQGAPLMPLLRAWRLSRNGKAHRALGAQCLNEISAIVDSFLADDREDGITSEMALEAARLYFANGFLYRDRRNAFGTRPRKRVRTA